jgi:hypothetical protein
MFPYSGVWWLADFVMAEGGGLRCGSPTAGLVVFTVVLAAGGGGCVLPDLGIKCGTVVLCRRMFPAPFWCWICFAADLFVYFWRWCGVVVVMAVVHIWSLRPDLDSVLRV